MKTYRLRLRKPDGQSEVKDIQAETPEEAEDLAKLAGDQPEGVEEIDPSPGWNLSFGGSVPAEELYHFTRLFATLTKAGIPLLETLLLLGEKARNALLKRTLETITRDIREGTGLQASFARHPRVFDQTFLNLLMVGEESGQLYNVLARLTELLKKQIQLRRMIGKALTYPVLVLVLSSAVTFGILTFIVPRFKDIYKRFGSDLPWLTKTTISASDMMVDHFFLFFGGMVGLLLLLSFLKRTETGKQLFDRLMLAIPVIGPMYHLYEIASLAKSFSILLHSGITVTTALDIIVPGIDLHPIRESVRSAASDIRAGKPMGESFTLQEPMLPDLLNRMVLVGERTGNLTEMLDHVAEFYEEEFYNQVERLASLIEPMLIVFLGVVIGGIVVSLYLPIFGMAKLIARR